MMIIGFILVTFVSWGFGPKFIAQYMSILTYTLIAVCALVNLYFLRKLSIRSLKGFPYHYSRKKKMDNAAKKEMLSL